MNILFFLRPKSEVAYIYDYHTLRQALEIMEYHKYSSVPILNREGKYVGTITEGDILRAIEALCHWDIFQAERVKICDVPRKRDHQAISINTDMDDLVDVIADQNFVPVIDDQEKFIGIITRKDVIQFYYDEHKKMQSE